MGNVIFDDVTILIDNHDISVDWVTSVTVTEKHETKQENTAKGAVAGVGRPQYSIDIEAVQYPNDVPLFDLAEYLRTSHAKPGVVVITCPGDDAMRITASVILAQLDTTGGKIGDLLSGKASFPVVGVPVWERVDES